MNTVVAKKKIAYGVKRRSDDERIRTLPPAKFVKKNISVDFEIVSNDFLRKLDEADPGEKKKKLLNTFDILFRSI